MNPIRAWNCFWFRPISARPLGAFRIVFGLIVLFDLALLSLDMDYWLTTAGILHGNEARLAAGPLRYSLLHYVQDPFSVHIFMGMMALIVTLFTLGWHTRLMSVLLYLGMMSIHHRNIASTNGADVLLMIIAFYLMLSSCGAAYSLDARRTARKRGTLAEPLIIPWAQRLIQIQIALIYINTGLMKAFGPTWQNGTALHYVLNNAEVRRFHLGLTQYPVLINLLTYAALMVELAIPFLLWFRAARPWTMLAGLGLHASILLFVNIPIFGELTTACYLTFLSVEELDKLLARINPARWWARPNAAPPELAEPPDRTDRALDLPGPHWLEWAGPPGQPELIDAGAAVRKPR